MQRQADIERERERGRGTVARAHHQRLAGRLLLDRRPFHNLTGRHASLYRLATQTPMWGYPVPVLGAISPFLEPFRGRLLPNIDNASEKMTLRYPHEGPWVVRLQRAELQEGTYAQGGEEHPACRPISLSPLSRPPRAAHPPSHPLLIEIGIFLPSF